MKIFEFGIFEFLKTDVLKELWTGVSSAYRLCLTFLALDRMELKGEVYIINMSGPSTELWSIPQISLGWDWTIRTRFAWTGYDV